MPQDVVVTVDQAVEISGENFTYPATSSVPVVSVKWFAVTTTTVLQLIKNEVLKVGPPVYCTLP